MTTPSQEETWGSFWSFAERRHLLEIQHTMIITTTILIKMKELLLTMRMMFYIRRLHLLCGSGVGLGGAGILEYSVILN